MSAPRQPLSAVLITRNAAGQLAACLVEDRHAVARRGQPHGARLHAHGEGIVVADRQGELGGAGQADDQLDGPDDGAELAPGKVRREAELGHAIDMSQPDNQAGGGRRGGRKGKSREYDYDEEE